MRAPYTGSLFMESMAYLSDDEGAHTAMELTEMSVDELECVVGRFRDDHHRFPGRLKGKVVVKSTGQVQLRHHFNNKLLWESDR